MTICGYGLVSREKESKRQPTLLSNLIKARFRYLICPMPVTARTLSSAGKSGVLQVLIALLTRMTGYVIGLANISIHCIVSKVDMAFVERTVKPPVLMSTSSYMLHNLSTHQKERTSLHRWSPTVDPEALRIRWRGLLIQRHKHMNRR